jgi:hypothetical protein
MGSMRDMIVLNGMLGFRGKNRAFTTDKEGMA